MILLLFSLFSGFSYLHFFLNLYIKNIIFNDAYKAEIEEKKEIKYEEKYWDLFLKNNDASISPVQDPAQISPVTEQRLEQLMNCILFEMTPVGNVIMRYNAKKEAFEYYSDCTIPYRFLDTVCRKYAVTFYCKSLYVIMNDEVKESEAKTKLLQEEKTKEQENGEHPKKKGVFAKFKTYNKEMGAGRTGKKPTEENAQIVVKQRINKFLYLGKTANFITGKKEVAEKPKLSFMDFKKMMFKK
jgi:hypothetical protein